ncbi:hypothetical protein BDR22DRAFT_820310 [Usnea florida]
MSFPAAESPDVEMLVEKTSGQALSAPMWHSIKPDGVSSEIVSTLEEPLGETDKKPAKSEKEDSGQSKKSNNSNVSCTSTVEYGHTPFDQYAVQVKELCHLLWNPSPKALQSVKSSRIERLFGVADNRMTGLLLPKRSRSATTFVPAKEFSIERLRGGGYNRVIGITIKHTTNGEPTNLILRVPRFDVARPDREVAILRFVRQHTTIPIPEVKHFDFTSDNPLKQPYVIHNRIPGFDLQSRNNPTCYLNLNQEQKCTFAKDFASILRQLYDIMHPFPGHIECSADNNNHLSFTVRHFDLVTIFGREAELDLNTKLPFFQGHPFLEDWEPPMRPPLEQTTYYFMIAQFGRWKARELRCDPASIRWSNRYDRLVTMADQMGEMGFLGTDLNCLCHLDLLGAPRNIMANINSDNSLSITGILDWDSAVFAPRFVGCAPPMWLWAWDDEEEDETHANDTPSTPEDQEIKRIFEETVGDDFLRYSYEPEYRLARKLFHFAQCGISSNTEDDEAEELLKEWAELRISKLASDEQDTIGTQDTGLEKSADGDDDSPAESKASL